MLRRSRPFLPGAPRDFGEVRDAAHNGPNSGEFAACDGKRVAISLPVGDQRRVLKGRARYEQDSVLGWILRVTLDGGVDDGNAQLLIRESQWQGQVIPDVAHGCNCLLIVETPDSSA
ncbi:MAG: hypothetical protein J5I93_05270 [Pirellulaceae bacterium]|nr:hypothetical protein [Pirellulaceae bacterium]